jgi:predicted nucleic acid-binding protein
LPAIVDASVLVAWSNRRDPDHRIAADALWALVEQPIVPALPLAEAAYLIGRDVGPAAEAKFIRNMTQFRLEVPTPADLYRMAELMEEYADWPLGAADASIVALAERLGVDTIVTFDRRHFGAIRPRHAGAFRVVP